MKRRRPARWWSRSLLFACATAVPLLVEAAARAAPEPAPAARPAGPAGAPEVRRTAVIEHHGERLLRSPLAIARDPKTGELVVSSFESGEVVVLDRAGALVARFGADAGLVTPYGVAVDAGGRIHVSELRTGLLKILGPGGTALEQVDLSKLAGRTVTPGRITLGEDGRVYVADLTASKILVVDREGRLVRELGPLGQLQKAAALGAGRIVGLSAQGTAVTLFDDSGSRVRGFGEHGEPSERTVSLPTGFAVDARDRIWIADAFQHRLKVFTLEGKFLFNVGLPEGAGRGGFFFPVDLCFGGPGELIVLEKGGERIQTFTIADLARSSR